MRIRRPPRHHPLKNAAKAVLDPEAWNSRKFHGAAECTALYRFSTALGPTLRGDGWLMLTESSVSSLPMARRAAGFVALGRLSIRESSSVMGEGGGLAGGLMEPS